MKFHLPPPGRRLRRILTLLGQAALCCVLTAARLGGLYAPFSLAAAAARLKGAYSPPSRAAVRTQQSAACPSSVRIRRSRLPGGGR